MDGARKRRSHPSMLSDRTRMPEYFDCMRCGHMSPVSSKPPKCSKCGSGAGVVVTCATDPRQGERDSVPGASQKETKPRQ
jgi:transcription elongation factor Elf1